MKYGELMENVNDETRGTYCAVRFSENTLDNLIALMGKLGVPNALPRTDLHTTILYSRKYLPEFTSAGVISASASAKGFTVFDSRDGNRCLVLELDSQWCEQRHRFLMGLHQATYDYPKYVSHITLSYNIGDFEKPSEDTLKDFPILSIVEEYDEDLNLLWDGN